MSKTERTGKPSTLKMRAETLLDGGINTKEKYLEALPLVFSLRQAAISVKGFLKAVQESEKALSDAAASYAKEHVTALDEPLQEVGGGMLRGSVTVNGQTYTLTLSKGALRRTTGDNMTQPFLKKLPQEWTRTKLELDANAMNGMDITDDKLFKYGLFRPENRTWSMKDKGEFDDEAQS